MILDKFFRICQKKADKAEIAMKDDLLQTKLQRSSVPPDVLPRDRMLDRLEKGRYRPLTLISAPAG